MKKMKNVTLLMALSCVLVLNSYVFSFGQDSFDASGRIPVKVLLLPKFEVGEISGDFPGEAQYYYENYLMDSDAYELSGDETLYIKDGVALATIGMGKVNAAVSTMDILLDDRFDFSDAYVISTGCAGSSVGTTVMGDVFIITSAVDYDLGHHADVREMKDPEADTWFYDESYDEAACLKLDPELTERVFDLVRDLPLKTTEGTRRYMEAAFEGEEWALRDPQVLRGTTVTGDNYWKGYYDHNNALLMVQTYGCPDPFVATEMEDIAIGQALKRLGMLDRYIIIRDSVNMDVFMMGNTPESLWGSEEDSLASEQSVESADIFETAMRNNFEAGHVVVDAILAGEF